jgi:hypothetical protein
VISPATVDLDELEANENIQQIDFTFTNYGLIRLSDVELTLPDEHPYLRFIIRQLPIGDVEANSSIIVTVDVYRINMARRKRALSIVSKVGSFIASYICGKIRTIGASLPAFISKYSPPINIPNPSSSGTVSWSGNNNGVIGVGNSDGSVGSSGDFISDLSSAIETFGSVIGPLFSPLLSSPTACESCVETILGMVVDLVELVSPYGRAIAVIDACGKYEFVRESVAKKVPM